MLHLACLALPYVACHVLALDTEPFILCAGAQSTAASSSQFWLCPFLHDGQTVTVIMIAWFNIDMALWLWLSLSLYALLIWLVFSTCLTPGCRYYLQGYCREGNKCRFGHNQQEASLGFSTPHALGATAVNSPFQLAASAQLPSATSLMDPAVAFQTGPTAPIAPVPQALAEPVLSSQYGSAESLDSSAAGFSFVASRPMDLQLSGPGLLLDSLDLGAINTFSGSGMPLLTSHEPSTPTGASNRHGNPKQLTPKQSPFPGVGAGVHGSSSFKYAGNLDDKLGKRPAA